MALKIGDVAMDVEKKEVAPSIGMKMYIGTRILHARPMTLGHYNTCRGWDIPKDEDPMEDGYLIETGVDRQSWLPTHEFGAYHRTNNMNFGLAIEAMKLGYRCARKVWNVGTFIVYMTPMNLPSFNSQGKGAKVNDRTAAHVGYDTPLDIEGYLAIFKGDRKWQPGWSASQSDMLSEDWMIVE